MIKNTVVIQERTPCKEERRTIYNPYSKKYELRKPTHRRNKKEELKMVMQHRDNERDVLWIGDKMSEQKNKGDIRIWLQNWNGVEKRNVDKMCYQLSQMVDNNIDYFSIPESKVNQYYKPSIKQWYKAADQILPHGGVTITSVPGFPMKDPHQPGGIMSGYMGRLGHRHQKTIRDQYGRWHVHQFYGKQRCLKIYNLYRVNPGTSESDGDTTAWTQQENLMTQNNDDRNPRKAVIEDIMQEFEKDIDDKISIIILADLNESVNGVEKTNSKFEELGLRNVMKECIGEQAMPRTHKQGSAAIDHMWATSNVLAEITQAGYAPFGFLKDSDHRGQFMDIKMENLLDEDVFNLTHHSKKRLKCSIPSRVDAYVSNIDTQWEYHNIQERFKEISQAFKDKGKTEENERKLNNLDKQITDIMIQSERKCSKVPSHSVGRWSIKLKNAIKKLIDTATKRTKRKKLYPGDNIEQAKIAFREADEEWKKAKEEYKEAKKKSKKLREDHIEECANRNVERNENKILESEIKRLKTIEAQREQAERMKFVLKPMPRMGVNTILIPAISAYTVEERECEGFDHHDIDVIWNKIIPFNGKDIIDWERITNKDMVQKMLLEWQRKHFTQASETPLGTTYWNDQLRNENIQDSILRGEYKAENVPSEVQELFDEMVKNSKLEEVEYASTFQEFITFIKGSSEKTSTSPSGRGYSHYKALLLEERWEQLEIIHGIIELARENGIILKRWRKTVTTLMEKDDGKPKIHRMRALHIIEAEVQFLAKLFYCKKLLHNAEQADAITDQQYGGRKNKMAQSAILNKLMYYNIVHQQLMEAAFMDDDARNCYDRIITALSAVELRAWGQSYEEAEFSVEFLQKQEYHIRTGIGITKEHYSYNRQDPTHGSGQGIGWAGVKFTKTSDTICRAMKKTCQGMKFEDPQGEYEVRKNGDLFVDDTAIGITANVMEKENTLLQLAHDQQKHAHLLFACGHKLALDKCSYYLVDYIRDGFRHRCKMKHELKGQLQLQEGFDTEMKTIKRLQPFESHKTLGSYISVNGNQRGQIRYLREKIENWCTKLKTRYLKGEDTLYAYQSSLLAALKYVLASSSISYKECDKMAKLIEPILINANGIQRNCDRNILYGSLKLGGLGVQHIYHVQGMEKLKFMCHHIRQNDITGILMRISCRWTQLELGLSQHFFLLDHQKYHHYVTNTWITHLWQYLSACNSQLHFIDEILPRRGNRDNDFYLMDEISNAPIPNNQKIMFNQIRLFLKVETVSDIVVANSGYKLCPGILEAKIYRTSKRGWPNIRPFPKKWIDTWKTLLQQYILPKLNTLRLGQWNNDSHQVWPAYMNQNESRIYYDSKYYSYWKKNVYKCDASSDVCTIPVDVHPYKKGIQLDGVLPSICKMDRVQCEVPKWKKRNWGTLEITTQEEEQILQHLQNDNIILASDGSVLDTGQAAHAYCIAARDTNEILIEACAPVDGDHDHMTSYRAEAFGALAAITLIDYIQKKHKCTEKCTIEMFIDNTDTIRTILGQKGCLRIGAALEDHTDIALELYLNAKNSQNSYIPTHVKSHMEDECDELSKAQILNQRMDLIVGQFVINPPPRLHPQNAAMMLPAQQVCLFHNSNPLISDIPDTLVLAQRQTQVIDYFSKQHEIKPELIHNLELNSMEKYLSSSKTNLGKRVKNINNQWNTMYTCKKWGTAPSDLCPLCHTKTETWKHIYQCSCMDMQRCKKEYLQKTSKKLMKLKTLPQLHDHILNVLKQWGTTAQIHDPADVPNSPYAIDLRAAHKAQKQVGYACFMKGFIVMEWAQLQSKYYRNERCPRELNIQRWKNSVIKILVDYGHELWVERCTIVAAENRATEDQRYREKMYKFMLQIKQNIDSLNVRNRHLVQRKKRFFLQSNRQVVEMWQIRVISAIQREKIRQEEQKNSIEQYVTRTKRRKRSRQHVRREPTFETTTSLRQTLIFNNMQQNQQEQQNKPIEQHDRHEFQLKRRRLENLTRKKRHRQARLIPTNLSINLPKRKKSRTMQSDVHEQRRHKKRKRYVPVPQYVRNIRDRFRASGKDLKNDR